MVEARFLRSPRKPTKGSADSCDRAQATHSPQLAKTLKQIDDLLDHLKDVTTVGWQERSKAMQDVFGLTQKVANLARTAEIVMDKPGSSLTIASQSSAHQRLNKQEANGILSKVLAQLAGPLCVQMMDLRSSVAKLAVEIVSQLAQEFPVEFAVSGCKYFREPIHEGLIKMLNNGNKIIAELAGKSI